MVEAVMHDRKEIIVTDITVVIRNHIPEKPQKFIEQKRLRDLFEFCRLLSPLRLDRSPSPAPTRSKDQPHRIYFDITNIKPRPEDIVDIEE